MKIVLITPYFFPILGGYTVITHNLYKQFKIIGHDVIIIAPGHEESMEYPDVFALKNNRVSLLDRINYSKRGDIFQFSFGLVQMNGLQKGAMEIIKEFQPDIIHTFGPVKYGYIGNVCVSDHTHWVHTFITQHDQRLSYIKRLLIKRLFRKVDLVTVTAKNQKEELEYMVGPKVDQVIGVGVDTDLFMPLEKKNDLRVGAVSNFVWLNKMEGVILLIKSFKEVVSIQPHAKLLIVGDGQYKYRLESVINDLHLESNVNLVGTLDQEQLSRFYNTIDIFAHISFQDTKPLTVLEAMSSGLPVVASRIGAIPEVVDETVGFITDFKEEEIAEKILKLLDSEDLRLKFGDNARNKILDNYSWENISKEYLQAYTDIRGGEK